MSFLHPEQHRECTKCGHRWYAEKWTRMDATKPAVGAGFTKRAQADSMQTTHERRLSKHDQWAKCAECGTKKIRTLKKN